MNMRTIAGVTLSLTPLWVLFAILCQSNTVLIAALQTLMVPALTAAIGVPALIGMRMLLK